MSNNERAALRERAVVYDEITNDTHRAPLTLEQLRQRLKHIAVLCWGLSIDINNEFARNEALQKENKRLQDEINGLRAELKLIRNRENARGVYKRKTRETLEAEANGETPPAPVPAKPKTRTPKPTKERKRKRDDELTPEELRKRNQHREWNARYYAKKRAEQNIGANEDGETSTVI